MPCSRSAFASLDLPLIGTVNVSSALVFDTGVYLTVVGMVLMAFEAFGDEPSGGDAMTVMLAAAAAALFAHRHLPACCSASSAGSSSASGC